MRQGVRVNLPRIHRVIARGKVYRYHRLTRALLPDLPEDSADFVAAWLAEEKRAGVKVKAAPGTIAAACTDWLSSPEPDRLSAGYRPTIVRHIKAIRDLSDDGIMADLETRHIRNDVMKLPPTIGASRLKAWRKLCGWLVDQKRLSVDPSEGIKKPTEPKTDGHKEWTHDDVVKFRDHWPIGTPQRLALELVQWTGARVSDACRLGPGMVRDGLLTYRQVKTGGECIVPLTRPAAWCDEDRADLLTCITGWPHMVWVVTAQGKARTSKGFPQWFSAAATDAGLPDLTTHGLRKYRMNRLAESGASVLVMQTWVGHATLAEVQHYITRANRRAAVAAVKHGDPSVKHAN